MTQNVFENYTSGWLEDSSKTHRLIREARRRGDGKNSGQDSDDFSLSSLFSYFQIHFRGEVGTSFDAYESRLSQDTVDGWFSTLGSGPSGLGDLMPDESVRNEARRIARRLRTQLPPDTDVYAMEGGKVAIELYGPFGYGFLLICEPGGGALCIVTTDGVSRRARYESSLSLPDGFIIEGLKDVRPAPTSVARA